MREGDVETIDAGPSFVEPGKEFLHRLVPEVAVFWLSNGKLSIPASIMLCLRHTHIQTYLMMFLVPVIVWWLLLFRVCRLIRISASAEIA